MHPVKSRKRSRESEGQSKREKERKNKREKERKKDGMGLKQYDRKRKDDMVSSRKNGVK